MASSFIVTSGKRTVPPSGYGLGLNVRSYARLHRERPFRMVAKTGVVCLRGRIAHCRPPIAIQVVADLGTFVPLRHESALSRETSPGGRTPGRACAGPQFLDPKDGTPQQWPRNTPGRSERSKMQFGNSFSSSIEPLQHSAGDRGWRVHRNASGATAGAAIGRQRHPGLLAAARPASRWCAPDRRDIVAEPLLEPRDCSVDHVVQSPIEHFVSGSHREDDHRHLNDFCAVLPWLVELDALVTQQVCERTHEDPRSPINDRLRHGAPSRGACR